MSTLTVGRPGALAETVTVPDSEPEALPELETVWVTDTVGQEDTDCDRLPLTLTV